MRRAAEEDLRLSAEAFSKVYSIDSYTGFSYLSAQFDLNLSLLSVGAKASVLSTEVDVDNMSSVFDLAMVKGKVHLGPAPKKSNAKAGLGASGKVSFGGLKFDEDGAKPADIFSGNLIGNWGEGDQLLSSVFQLGIGGGVNGFGGKLNLNLYEFIKGGYYLINAKVKAKEAAIKFNLEMDLIRERAAKW